MTIGSSGRALLLLLALASAAAEAVPQRVLIVRSFGRDFGPSHAMMPVLRSELARLARQPLVYQDVTLHAEHGGALQDNERPLVNFLLERYASERPDLMIAVGRPAVQFFQRQRERLFPQVPLLMIVAERGSQGTQLRPQDRLVTFRLDFSGAGKTILQLLPDTTTLAVVGGSSVLERFWLKEIGADLARSSADVELVWLTDLTLGELQRRVGSLPPRSAVLYFLFTVDAEGVPQESEQTLQMVSTASSAPVFGMFGAQLGEGIVGGDLLDYRRVGLSAARAGHDMLRGVPAAAGQTEYVDVQLTAFDARQLERWGIPDSRLPPGAEVRFRPPSVWQQHKALILTGAGIVLLQAALIFALLFHRARRRRAEKEALNLSGRLLTAHEDERRRLARDLHDDVSQQLAGLSIAFSRLKQRMLGVRTSEDLQTDVRALHERTTALAQNVRHLSHDLHPTVLRHAGLVAALTSYCGELGLSHGAALKVSAEGDMASIDPEAALCLYRIAQEALRNVMAHAGASSAQVRVLRHGDHAELSITDDGKGFDVAGSLKQGTGLGLVSITERVKLAGGSVSITAEPGKGTRVHVRIPAGALATNEGGLS